MGAVVGKSFQLLGFFSKKINDRSCSGAFPSTTRTYRSIQYFVCADSMSSQEVVRIRPLPPPFFQFDVHANLLHEQLRNVLINVMESESEKAKLAEPLTSADTSHVALDKAMRGDLTRNEVLSLARAGAEGAAALVFREGFLRGVREVFSSTRRSVSLFQEAILNSNTDVSPRKE